MVEAAVLVNERLSGELQQAITALSWSPGGEFLAIASAGGELLLLDFPAGCEELLCGNSDESLSAIGFSADCCFLMAVGQASCLLLWELGGSGLRPMAIEPISLECGWIDQALWQPVGSLLAVGAGREVRLWDSSTRGWFSSRLDLPGTVQSLAWSADGKQLAASCHGELVVWNPLASPEIEPLRIPTGSAGLVLAFSPIADLLACGQMDRSLLVWPQFGQGRPWRFSGFPAKVRSLSWGKNRGRLAPSLAVASAENVVIWEQRDISERGWHPNPLVWHQEKVQALSFSPGSSLLASASADGTVALWDGRGRLLQPLEGDGQGFQCLAWRGDGLHLAAGDNQGSWWLWPVAVPAREKQNRTGGFGFGQ